MDSRIKIAKEFVEAPGANISHLSDDAKIIGASGTHYGKPKLEQLFKQFTSKPFKDVVHEPVRDYVIDDIVIIESVMKGVHVGNYMGIPPSNKLVVMPSLNVFEFEGDKIVAWRQYQNFKILADQHNR
jgi:hypothetical protein